MIPNLDWEDVAFLIKCLRSFLKCNWLGLILEKSVTCPFNWVEWPKWTFFYPQSTGFLGFPCGSAGKESACNVGDLGSIPGLGRSPGEGKGYWLQYSGLENSRDYTVHGVAKSQTWLSNFHFHFSMSWLTSQAGLSTWAIYFTFSLVPRTAQLKCFM